MKYRNDVSMGRNVAVIQARMGSTRLPGKVMLPLGGVPNLRHIIDRVKSTNQVDTVVVATTKKEQDDIIAKHAARFGADIYRGSSHDVLKRVLNASSEYNADLVIRITGDCPLISPQFIDFGINAYQSNSFDFAGAVDRTLPRGTTSGIVPFDILQEIDSKAGADKYREHVTLYIRENPNNYNIKSIGSANVFSDERLQNRNDLRFTLDKPADYDLLNRIYSLLYQGSPLKLSTVFRMVDEDDLGKLNANVQQRHANVDR